MKVKMHAESLLNIPLVREAFESQLFLKVARGQDAEWGYSEAQPKLNVGFNPFSSSFFYAQNSQISKWFRDPYVSARNLNENDLLMTEVLFYVHDYLHWWTYQLIHQLIPKLDFGKQAITTNNFEDYVFCHLVSETAATVGLDYWYLGTTDLNSVCSIGTRRGPITTGYRFANENEYHRYNPELKTQVPSFFNLMCRFYCDGIFPGFTLADLKESPQTMAWIKPELEYGENQREYTREWFSFLSADKISAAGSLDGPVPHDKKWQKQLIEDVGKALWKKIKMGGAEASDVFTDLSKVLIKSDSGKVVDKIDLRFQNLGMVDLDLAVRWASRDPEKFEFLFDQFVARHRFADFDPELIKILPALRQSMDFSLVQRTFRGVRQIPMELNEPEHIFQIS